MIQVIKGLDDNSFAYVDIATDEKLRLEWTHESYDSCVQTLRNNLTLIRTSALCKCVYGFKLVLLFFIAGHKSKHNNRLRKKGADLSELQSAIESIKQTQEDINRWEV